MSKMSELEMVITDLRTAVTTIKEVADTLSEMFSGTTTEEAIPAESTPTLEEVRAILADLSRKGHTTEIRSLLQKYGSEKLSGVDPTKYTTLLKDAEGLKNGE